MVPERSSARTVSVQEEESEHVRFFLHFAAVFSALKGADLHSIPDPCQIWRGRRDVHVSVLLSPLPRSIQKLILCPTEICSQASPLWPLLI